MKALLGLGVVALHAGLFLVLAGKSAPGLTVTLDAPLTAQTLTLDGVVPAELRDRVTIADEGQAPGLVRRTWSVSYRGGYTRSVGAAQLVGPFQAPDSHACTGRILVGQSLLDGGPGTIGAIVQQELDGELRGTTITGVGDYLRIADFKLAWARITRPEDIALTGGAPAFIRATLTVVFERVNVPIEVVLVPKPGVAALDFKIAVRATLDFDNRVLDWISDKLNGDAIATRFARAEIDAAVIAALEPPPPLELGDGVTLHFTYCQGDFDVEANAWGALPFRVVIGRVEGAPLVLPPRRGGGPRPPLAAGAKLAVDLDLDALNAMLYEVWRTGYLDKQLAAAGLDTRFNTDPTVTEYLSLRISRPVLALPPVLSVNGDGLRLSADARVTIADGAMSTVGRVWGAIDLAVRGPEVLEPIPADLAQLELACAQGTQLRPCYADLVAAVRSRRDDFHAPLTAVTQLLLAQLANRRLADASVPGELVIERVVPYLSVQSDTAMLRLQAEASVVQ